MDSPVDSEITAYLQQNGVQFTESDILRPTPAVAQRVYEHFLQTFLGLSPEAYGQPSAEVTSMLEHPELYSEALSLMTFCGMLTKMFNDIYCPGFSLRDILKPEPTRFRSILYHATTFANFRKEHVEIFEESNRQKEQLLGEKENLESTLQNATEKLNALKLQRSQEEPLVDALKEDLSKLHNELLGLRKIQHGISADIENVKTERVTVKDKLTSHRTHISALKQDINKLKSKIVDNPERLFQIIAELNQKITGEKATLATVEKKSRDLASKIEGLQGLEQDLVKSTAMMKDVESEIKKLEETNKQIQQQKDVIARQQSELKDLNAEDQHHKRQLTSIQEKIAKLQKQQEVKRKSLEEKLVDMKREYEALIVERDEKQREVEANEKQYREIVTKMNEARRKHEQNMQQTVTTYDKMRLQVTEYCSEMKKTLQ